jgi:acyl-coenzyme A synthetase/AMP-(fatty) acid ligase
VPAAVVQLKAGAETPTFPELEAHLRRHVLATHIPVSWKIVEEMPRTPSMKIDRPALAGLFATDESD